MMLRRLPVPVPCGARGQDGISRRGWALCRGRGERLDIVEFRVVETVDPVLAGRENVREGVVPAQAGGGVLVTRHQRLASRLVDAADGEEQEGLCALQ